MQQPVHDHDSAEGLAPVEEYRDDVLSSVEPLAPIELHLQEALGCVAARDVSGCPSLRIWPPGFLPDPVGKEACMMAKRLHPCCPVPVSVQNDNCCPGQMIGFLQPPGR